MRVLTSTDHHQKVLLRAAFTHRAVCEDMFFSGLITQRSLVQIQPPPPTKALVRAMLGPGHIPSPALIDFSAPGEKVTASL